ncbi:MAG TPA: DUF3786 domain-containing protein [Clostridia bacterium]|nr:DUF3786 domain-containing protein [Clostridia bacterium]
MPGDHQKGDDRKTEPSWCLSPVSHVPSGSPASPSSPERVQYADALNEALRVYREKDPRTMALSSGAVYQPERRYFLMGYCNDIYSITYPDGEVSPSSTKRFSMAPSVVERILMLKYLSAYGGVAPSGKWVAFEELKSGPHHSKPFRDLAIKPLVERFGDEPEAFEACCVILGGSRLSFGSALAFCIPALPKVPLAVILWSKDEEFESRASILFDAASEHHLDTASLYMLGIEVSSRLRALYDML